MKAIFVPGFAILGRMGVGTTMALISALYLVPVVALLYLGSDMALALTIAAVSLALALYLSAANAVWTRIGMARLSKTAERIASGDLSFRMARSVGEKPSRTARARSPRASRTSRTAPSARRRRWSRRRAAWSSWPPRSGRTPSTAGARRRAGPRLCSGGDRGAQPGATQRRGSKGDKGADRGVGGQRRRGRAQRQPGERNHRQGGQEREKGGESDRGDRHGIGRAEHRNRGDQPRDHPAGGRDPAERRAGRADQRRHGAERVLAEFNDPRGAFVDGDFYILVLDARGVVRANGGNPSIVGRNDWESIDADGKKQTQALIATAQERGMGWVDYRWPNPKKAGKIERKSTYCELVEDLVVGCGIYTSDAGKDGRRDARRDARSSTVQTTAVSALAKPRAIARA